MKKQNLNKLAFNKTSLIELNDNNLSQINGGTNPVITVPLIPVVSFALAGAAAVSLEIAAGLAQGATDAIRTK